MPSIVNKFTRVEADSPFRCQAMCQGAITQCPYKKIEGTEYCPLHAGFHIRFKKEENKRIYRLSKWQHRVGEIAEHDKVKSLREEIGIARMLLEEILNLCGDSNTLLLYSSRISDLVTRIEKLVSSCHRLEASTGILLDKQAALQIATSIITIIGNYVPDDNIIEKISNDIIEMIKKTNNKLNLGVNALP